MNKKLKKKTERADCPRGLWQVLIDAPLPPDDPDYNKFQEFISKADWMKHREAVLKYWIAKHPGTRPKNFWMYEGFGLPFPGQSKEKAALLKKNGLLTATEQEILKSK